MTEIVKTDGRQAEPRDGLAEGSGGPVWMSGAALGTGEHQVVLSVVGAHQEAFLQLLGAKRLQGREGRGVQGDTAPPSAGLGV